MFNPDLIYDIARSVTNWHIENVNKTADKKNKTAFQTALEESPFTTNKPLVALFNACNTTPST